MAAASRDARPRPPIQPIRTTGPGHGSHATTTQARMAFKSPAWLATPYSPMSRPPPMYPDSEDDRMRELDKAAVDRLEPRSRNSPNPEMAPRTAGLKPISEFVVSASPLSAAHQRPPLSAPLLPLPGYRRPTIAEETRSMLLHDAGSDRLAHHLHPHPHPHPPPHALGRRGSAPPSVLRARNMQLQRQREHLRRRGLAGPYRSREPDLLVVPVELRRLSTIATHTADGDMPSPHPVDGRLTTRVVIHSRNRKPLVLTRTFDLNELRATIPRHVHQSSSSSPAPALPALPALPCSRRASLATLQVPTPVTGNRSRSPLSAALARERRHSTAGTPVSDLHPSPRSESRRHHRPRFAAVPMHLEYARKYLPVLAAIILSELVRPGDTLELPLPHPRYWEETVAYIYTGRVEITDPIRQNIIYLGGRA